MNPVAEKKEANLDFGRHIILNTECKWDKEGSKVGEV